MFTRALTIGLARAGPNPQQHQRQAAADEQRKSARGELQPIFHDLPRAHRPSGNFAPFLAHENRQAQALGGRRSMRARFLEEGEDGLAKIRCRHGFQERLERLRFMRQDQEFVR